MNSAIAIVEPQYLVAVGLRTLLEALLPHTDILIYSTIEQLRSDIERKDGNRPYFVHYFVNDNILWANQDLFRSLPQITIGLSHGNDNNTKGFPMIEVNAPENVIVKQLLHLRTQGHAGTDNQTELSQREKEVLKLVVKGMLNKEIADKLCVSFNTVITHRQHITRKLGIRSVPALTIYAVSNAIVGPSEIYKENN